MVNKPKKKEREIAKEIVVDAKAGKDKYRLVVGSTGSNSALYRNGEIVKGVTRAVVDVPADGRPMLTFYLMTVSS